MRNLYHYTVPLDVDSCEAQRAELLARADALLATLDAYTDDPAYTDEERAWFRGPAREVQP